ncbi:TetR/AcrR family transcriptional regulator [Polymorphum gilvum]|uniref:Transcriptional regulator, TetR family protein n=1 Tax=Polymorphum gilvum (strain LMG 25793 / CGMCC 1.9160 / SL003B-26A1) TaxID=991905 RepID=F2J087_POLGS|nr:TetR/AcrR family transcriptional regulator [Polymorphum gilvum]ADZ68622.1 Transcriptional regulator, TetR family protein [Polymorphum gilvum SL003B-26A1]
MSGDQAQSVSDRKRKQIIEAAIAEFQQRGFAGASMDRISERAGVSKRTVYNHFDSKEALFRAIADCLAERMSSVCDMRYGSGEPVAAQLARLGWAEGALLIDPCFMRMARMLMGEAIRDPHLATAMAAKVDKMCVFEGFMRAAFADGALANGEPDIAAAQFLGLIKARGFFPQLMGGALCARAEMDAIIADAVALILRAYGPRPSRVDG